MAATRINKQLYDAVRAGDRVRTRELLAAGASANADGGQDGWHRPCLCHAVMLNDAVLVKMLLDAKADPDVADDGDFAALHYAIRDKFFDIADLLLAHGANIDVRAGRDAGLRLNAAPLHTAVYTDFKDGGSLRVDYLLSRGASNAVLNAQKRTPSQIARDIGAHALATKIEKYQADCARDAVSRGIEGGITPQKIKIRRKKGPQP